MPRGGKSLPSNNGQWVTITFNHYIEELNNYQIVAYLENESDRMFYISHTLAGKDRDEGVETVFVERPMFINKDFVVLVEPLLRQPVEGEIEEW